MDQSRSPSPTSTDVFATETTKPSTAKRPRKKNKRPSKRFLQEDLHLRFIAAIFDLGLKNASPKLLLPLMNKSDPNSGLTTEHLKSHPQKYRINYEHSRREFRAICNNEIKRDRKRHREEERRTGTFAVLVHGRSDNTTSPNATDSGSGYEDASNSANIVGKDSQMRPIVSSSEQDGVAASVITPVDYLPVQEIPVAVSDSSSVPELTDAQWRTFSMLMSGPPADKGGSGALSIPVPQEFQFGQGQVQEELQQMHQAMQARMNFHRQMLTRNVELSGDLYPSSDLVNCEYGDYYRASVQEPEPSAFQQAWTSTQQIHQRHLASHRLQQLQQIDIIEESPQQYLETLPDASGSASHTLSCHLLPMLIDRPLKQVELKRIFIVGTRSMWDLKMTSSLISSKHEGIVCSCCRNIAEHICLSIEDRVLTVSAHIIFT